MTAETHHQEMVERGLARSHADATVVIVDEISTANLRWANNTMTTNGETQSTVCTVIAAVNGGVSTVVREGATLDSLDELVTQAETEARTAPRAEDLAALIDGGSSPDWAAPPEWTSSAVFSPCIPELGNVLREAPSRHEVLYGYAEHSHCTSYLGTSSGTRLRDDSPVGHIEINGKSSDLSRSAWWAEATSAFDGVDIQAAVNDISTRLGWQTRHIDCPAGRYATILPSTAVADFMICLYWAALARDAQEGRTVFSLPGGRTRVGEQLTELPVTLSSDPSAPNMPCMPFLQAYSSSSASSVFDNGAPLAPTTWIDNGTLAALIQTRLSADLTHLAFTPWIDNLAMTVATPSHTDLTSLIGSLDDGLLLTSLWYIRDVDPQTLLLTGLTRDGVYRVEHGEVSGSVTNFRFNESPVELLRRISAAGVTERTYGREWGESFNRTSMPPLLISDFNMSSVSPAL